MTGLVIWSTMTSVPTVVLDGEGLSTQRMQSIAREFNLSGTTFVLQTTVESASYGVRIFRD